MEKPALIGSDKQIAWATNIRAAILDQIETFEAKIASSASADAKATYAGYKASVIGQTKAAWWIAQQHCDYQTIIQLTAKGWYDQPENQG